MADPRPIGIFDSGVGGLTVVKSLLSRLPRENFIYFGDTAHIPYGNKSKEQLFTYADKIISFLLKRDVKAIMVACGTHSAITLPYMKERFSRPLLGVLNPACRAAVKSSNNKKIGVLATAATVNSHAYYKEIKKLDPSCEVFEVACSRFVPMVEANQINGSEIRDVIKEYITPLLQKEIDTLVLGCTHYPFLESLIKEFIGENIKLVDPSIETIEELVEIFKIHDLFNKEKDVNQQEFWVSGSDTSFYQLGSLLPGVLIRKVEKIVLD